MTAVQNKFINTNSAYENRADSVLLGQENP